MKENEKTDTSSPFPLSHPKFNGEHLHKKRKIEDKLFRKELCLTHTVPPGILDCSNIIFMFNLFLVDVCLVDWLVYLFFSDYECVIHANNFLHAAFSLQFCSQSLWFY